jgi:hypothetical protein
MHNFLNLLYKKAEKNHLSYATSSHQLNPNKPKLKNLALTYLAG